MVRDAFLAPHMPQPKFGSKWLRDPTTSLVLEIGFGPPTTHFGSIWSSKKRVNFIMFKSKVKILINMSIQFSSSFCFLIFCLSPKFIWFPKLLLQLSFLVFQNVFGPPTTVAVVVDFKNRGVSHLGPDHSQIDFFLCKIRFRSHKFLI